MFVLQLALNDSAEAGAPAHNWAYQRCRGRHYTACRIHEHFSDVVVFNPTRCRNRRKRISVLLLETLAEPVTDWQERGVKEKGGR
jgi:hypothetical protein